MRANNVSFRRVSGLRSDGLFVDMSVLGVDLNAIVDTGSTVSVLHPDKYDLIPAVHRPQMDPMGGELVMGDGGIVVPQGTVDLEVCMGSSRFVHTFVVADVQVPAVLGYDFLY